MVRKFAAALMAGAAAVVLSTATASAADYDYPDDRGDHYSGDRYSGAGPQAGYYPGGHVTERVYEDDDNDVVVIERDHYYSSYGQDGSVGYDDGGYAHSAGHKARGYGSPYWRD